MKTKTNKKLALSRLTLRSLNPAQLRRVNGGDDSNEYSAQCTSTCITVGKNTCSCPALCPNTVSQGTHTCYV